LCSQEYSCYFLLNYASIPRPGSLHGRSLSLAIFFWIMLVFSVVDAYTVETFRVLAIFFWIMHRVSRVHTGHEHETAVLLFSFELCAQVQTQPVQEPKPHITCYFLFELC